MYLKLQSRHIYTTLHLQSIKMCLCKILFQWSLSRIVLMFRDLNIPKDHAVMWTSVRMTLAARSGSVQIYLEAMNACVNLVTGKLK